MVSSPKSKFLLCGCCLPWNESVYKQFLRKTWTSKLECLKVEFHCCLWDQGRNSGRRDAIWKYSGSWLVGLSARGWSVRNTQHVFIYELHLFILDYIQLECWVQAWKWILKTSWAMFWARVSWRRSIHFQRSWGNVYELTAWPTPSRPSRLNRRTVSSSTAANFTGREREALGYRWSKPLKELWVKTQPFEL